MTTKKVIELVGAVRSASSKMYAALHEASESYAKLSKQEKIQVIEYLLSEDFQFGVCPQDDDVMWALLEHNNIRFHDISRYNEAIKIIEAQAE